MLKWNGIFASRRNQIVTRGKYVSFTNKYYILKDYRTVWNASLNSCFNEWNPRITKDRLVTLTWRPFGGGSCRTRSFIRETFAISAATASWCVAFLMSFPLTYKKAWFWITQKNPLFCWNKVTLKGQYFQTLRRIGDQFLNANFRLNLRETFWRFRLLSQFGRTNFKAILASH